MINDQRGMNLIEKLLAITLLSVIAIVAITVISPSGRKAEQRNAERLSDVQSIYTAVTTVLGLKASPDAPEELEAVLDDLDTNAGTVQMLVRRGAEDFDCATLCGEQVIARQDCTVDLSTMPKDILPKIPVDPGKEATDTVTGYYINISNNLLTVGACVAEREPNGRTPAIFATESRVTTPL